jgi:hypothetical protein
MPKKALKIESEKGICIHLDINVHCEMKKRAAIKNISMKDWLTIAILERIAKEDKYN